MPQFDPSQRPPRGFRDPRRNTNIKIQSDIKQMIIGALGAVGGQAYLERQANENPVAFMGLLKAILPLQVKANVRHDIRDIPTAELLSIIASCSEGDLESEAGGGEPGTLH